MLKGYQKAYLKGLAHHRDPIVNIGKAGASEALIKEISFSLEKQELIKVKFLEFKDEKNNLLEEVLKLTKAELVQLIGNIAILFRQNKKEEEQIIKLPVRNEKKAVVKKKVAKT